MQAERHFSAMDGELAMRWTRGNLYLGKAILSSAKPLEKISRRINVHVVA
jgi:hypothetical protein